MEGLGAGLFQGLVAGRVQLVGEHEAAGLDVGLVRDFIIANGAPPETINGAGIERLLAQLREAVFAFQEQRPAEARLDARAGCPAREGAVPCALRQVEMGFGVTAQSIHQGVGIDEIAGAAANGPAVGQIEGNAAAYEVSAANAKACTQLAVDAGEVVVEERANNEVLVELPIIADLDRPEAAHAADAVCFGGTGQAKNGGLGLQVAARGADTATSAKVEAGPGGGRHVFRSVFQAAGGAEVSRLGGAHAYSRRERRSEDCLLHCVYSPDLRGTRRNAYCWMEVYREVIQNLC